MCRRKESLKKKPSRPQTPSEAEDSRLCASAWADQCDDADVGSTAFSGRKRMFHGMSCCMVGPVVSA